MIVYQVTPCRLYPQILQLILNNIKINTLEFWQLYDLVDDNDWNKKDNIMGSIPSWVKIPRIDGFLYGAFDSEKINKKSKDFIFTVVNHPIDHVYEVYARWNNLYNISYDKKLNNFFKNSLEMAHPEIIQSNKMISLVEYIDKILNKEDLIFQYKNIRYKIFDEIVYGYKNINYTGRMDNLNGFFQNLSNIFNVKIPCSDFSHTLSYQGDKSYRIKDLENLFKDQIDYYNTLK